MVILKPVIICQNLKNNDDSTVVEYDVKLTIYAITLFSRRLTWVGSPRVELKFGEHNQAHFMVSQKFYNPTQTTMSL